jgi:Reverse transcriptase (RNA-dependent DNA polymerase)
MLVDYDETFSPVAKMAYVYIYMSLNVVRHWSLHQLDVKNIFLNSIIEKKVYMTRSRGFFI